MVRDNKPQVAQIIYSAVKFSNSTEMSSNIGNSYIISPFLEVMDLHQPQLFLCCNDLETTKSFYHGTLELEYIATEHEILIFKTGATILRISQIATFVPQQFTILGWFVDDIEQVIDQLVTKGVKFIHYPQFKQDKRGIWHAGIAKIGYFHDPSNNVLSLTEMIDV